MKKIILTLLYTVLIVSISKGQSFPAGRSYVGAGPDIYAFPNITAQIYAQGGVSYEWNTATGLSDSTIADPLVNVSDTAMYILKMGMDTGGYIFDTVFVFVIEATEGAAATCTNLVNNGSLDTGPCGSNQIGLLATGWLNGNAGGTSDWLSFCLGSSPPMGIPSNDWSNGQTPHSGAGMAATILYDNWNPSNGFEYIQQNLQCPLLSGQTYTLSFWAAHAQKAKYSCGHVGMLLTATRPYPAGWGQITLTPQAGGVQGSNTGWTNYTATFTPSGTLPWLTIGDFTTPLTGCTAGTGSWDVDCNFIDDVVIKPLPPVITTTAVTACSGSTFTLCATGGANYTWTGTGVGTGTTSCITVTAPTVTATTVYTYTVTTTLTCPSTCSYTAATSVTVTPNPIISVNSASICPGGTTTLTATGASTYTWSPGTGLSSTTGSTVTANPSSTTVYTITGTGSSGCNGTATSTVTVYATPTIVVSNTAICVGSSAVLTASGASTYTWNPGGMTGATVTVTPSSTQVYTITGTSAQGCAGSTTATVTVNPLPTLSPSANPSSICSSTSTNTTSLSVSGASTYTWNPAGGSSLSCTICSSPTATLTGYSTYVFTVTGTSSVGCINSVTISVSANQTPTLTATNYTICIGSQTTATVTGAGAGGTYSWTPSTGLSQTTGTSVVASPTTTTVYTITGTTSAGCTGTKTLSVTVNPKPSFTLTANPSTICAPSYPVTSALSMTVTNAGTYTWTPPGGSSLSCTVNPCLTPTATINNSGSFTFSVAATSTAGCTNSSTVNVSVTSTPTVGVSAGVNPLCQGLSTVLTATGATTYSWAPSGSLSSSTGTTVTATPTTTTTYTITGTTNTCTANAVFTLTVTPMPTITITPTGQSSCNYTAPGSATICPGGTATLTATSGGALTSYTWTPGPLTGTAVAVSPTVTTTYTVNGTGSGCPGTKTITITVSTCFCSGPALPALTNTTIATGGPYSMNTSYTVTGNVNLIGIDIKIAPTVSITVPNGAYLRIQGSHLSSCNSMWQGIDVQPGGKLTVENNSLIEDAIAAADDNPTGALHTAASASITVNGAVFNCNRTAIRRAFYQSTTPGNYTTTQFRVNDAVITCRCNLPWPITTSTLTVYSNTVTGTPNPSAPDLSDFYSVSNWTSANLKPPYFGAAAYDGVRLENVGVNTASVVPLTYVTHVGDPTGTLVLFDNLIYGINVSNTTFSVSNTAYQEPRAISSGGKNPTYTGGFGINAIKTEPDWYPGIDVKSSRFIHMVRGIHNIDYFNIDAETNKLFSRIAIVPVGQVNLGVAYGSYGMYFSTSRFATANIRTNDLANLTNGVVYSISTATYVAGNGQHVGPITIDQNTLKDQFTGNSYTSKYIGTAISVSNVLTPVAGSTVTPATGTATPVYVGNNTISGAFNGIYQSNHQWQRPRTENNTITLQYQPTIQFESIQYGIQHANCIFQSNYGDAIHDNVVTGYFATTYTFSSSNQALFEKKKGIWSRFSGNHYVTCNDVYHSGRGFEFEGAHTKIYWAKNTMNHCGEAYSITNSGAIGTQSTTPNNANDNQWLSTTNTFADTYTDANSAPLGSILWLNAAILPLGPQTNTTTAGGTPYTYASGLLQPKNACTYTCTSPPNSRVIGANERSTNGDSLDIDFLESIVLDSVFYPTYSLQNAYINKNMVYRLLRRNPDLLSSSILHSFYNNTSTSSWALFCAVEDSLVIGNYTHVNTLLSNFSAANGIERNYMRFYQIYSSAMIGNHTSLDSVDLLSLASSCPMLNGTVVFQARALRNSLLAGFENYEDNCPQVEDNSEKSTSVGLANSSRALVVFPNPSNGKLYISGFTAKNKANVVEVTDVTGKVILKQNVPLTNGMIELNLDLRNGVYFIKCQSEGEQQEIHKVIINR